MRHPESTSGDAWVEGRHKELSRVNYIWLWTGSLRVCIHCQGPLVQPYVYRTAQGIMRQWVTGTPHRPGAPASGAGLRRWSHARRP